jgi:cholesterol transport system auxiliary component
MKKHTAWVVFTLALAAIFAGGCGAARPNKYYQLSVPADAPAANADQFPITLLIGRMTASDLYREDQIVYSSGGESMGTYEYHRWSEPPTEMIQEIVLRQFRASGRFHGVYALRSDMHGDYILHGHLYDFKEVTANGAVGRVAMEMELRDVKADTSVWTHFYSHDEPAAGNDVDSVVAALDKNVQQGVAEMRAGVEQYFTAHPPVRTAP